MDGLVVEGTAGQLLLLTLASTIDDMDASMQQQCAALKADVCKLVKPIPEQAATQGNPLVSITPPADESAEEEAQRLVQEIKDPKNANRKNGWDHWGDTMNEYWGKYDRDVWADVRHAANKLALQKRGFHVRGWKEDGPFCDTYVQWKSSDNEHPS